MYMVWIILLFVHWDVENDIIRHTMYSLRKVFELMISMLSDWLKFSKSKSDWMRAPSIEHEFENPSQLVNGLKKHSLHSYQRHLNKYFAWNWPTIRFDLHWRCVGDMHFMSSISSSSDPWCWCRNYELQSLESEMFHVAEAPTEPNIKFENYMKI